MGLENDNARLGKMERLHIYSGSYSDEPSYLNLLTGLPWSQLVTPPIETSRQRASRMTQARLLQEIKLCAQVARTLAVRLGEDATLLNRLRAVSFGDIPNITWTSPLAQKTEIETLSAGPELALQYKSLARTLVNLPNVAHTCQATQFGPLGLSHGANRIKNPPSIFTYHPRLASHFCKCTDALGPIILSTTNRHYYTCLYTLENESVIAAEVIDNIVGSVCSTPISDKGEDEQPASDLELSNTVVELYDYIRVSESTQNSWSDPIPITRGHSVRACRPATSLDLFQEILDERLPAKWRGRVILKNREDAPPCTACGLNLAEQWDDYIEDKGVESGQILPCSQVHY